MDSRAHGVERARIILDRFPALCRCRQSCASAQWWLHCPGTARTAPAPIWGQVSDNGNGCHPLPLPCTQQRIPLYDSAQVSASLSLYLFSGPHRRYPLPQPAQSSTLFLPSPPPLFLYFLNKEYFTAFTIWRHVSQSHIEVQPILFLN